MIYEIVEQKGKPIGQDYQVADEQTDISSLELNVAVKNDLKVVLEADASLVTDGVFDGVCEEVEEANPSGAAPAILHALSTLESDAKDCDDSTTAKDCLSASVLVEPSVSSSVNASNGSLSGMDMTNLGSGCEEKKRSSAPAIPINSEFTFCVPLSMPRFTFAPAVFSFGASNQAATAFTFRATSSFAEPSGQAESIVILDKEDGSALPDSSLSDDQALSTSTSDDTAPDQPAATKRTPTQKRNRRRRAAKKRQREADAAAAAEALATPGASGSESA